MIFEIRGVGFHNKGAELMLRAVLEQGGRFAQAVDFAVEPGCGTYAARARYGLLQIMEARRHGRLGWVLDLLFHAGYRSHYGMVKRHELDGVLDASGYAYGDPWGRREIERALQAVRSVVRNGGRIVMLPQSFGPFENRGIRESFRRLAQDCALIYARDETSRGYLETVVPPGCEVARAPDITHLVKGRLPDGYALERPAACLIPNQRVVSGRSSNVLRRYTALMASASMRFKRAGLNPVFLLHETEQDRDLVKEIMAASIQATVIDERDPVVLKGIIGTCEVVVGSRYHALVNALSQGVISLGIGWSHKYAELFRDYGCPEMCVGRDFDDTTVERLLGRLVDERFRAEMRQRLLEKAAANGEMVRRMWKRVEEVLFTHG